LLRAWFLRCCRLYFLVFLFWSICASSSMWSTSFRTVVISATLNLFVVDRFGLIECWFAVVVLVCFC
jgi:L-asparagine transporter-like permease